MHSGLPLSYGYLIVVQLALQASFTTCVPHLMQSSHGLLPAPLSPFLQIRFLQSPNHLGLPLSYGYLMAALLGLLAFAFPFLHHQIWFRCQVIGWNLRVASMTASKCKHTAVWQTHLQRLDSMKRQSLSLLFPPFIGAKSLAGISEWRP